MEKYGESRLVLQMIPHYPRYKHVAKFILILIAWSALVIGLANPRLGTKLENVKREGVDVVIALDVSKSMLAEDIKPNRLTRAKRFVQLLIDEMESDRIALIIFAGNAYLQMPLTVDHSAARMFLSNVNTDLVPTQGTAIGDAIEKAQESFESGEENHKALIIITDGENHESDAVEMAETAADDGVVIHTIGIGTPQGAPIPVYRRGVEAAYKLDKQGSIVLSKLNERILQQIALVSGGDYYRMTSGNDQVLKIMNRISSMEKKTFEELVFTEYDDKFQIPLAIALLFLILELFVSDRRSKWISKLLYFDDENRIRA